MSREDPHETVDIGKIELKSVRIEEEWDEEAARRKKGPPRTYVVTYGLPRQVSKTWQQMFQKPSTMSGRVHQVEFRFNEDGSEVSALLSNEPAPELMLVLQEYAKRANARWNPYREKILANRDEEARILKKLKEST